MKPAHAVAAIALLSLTACSGQTLTLSQSPNEITLRWWSDELADAQVQDIAGGYCTQFGKAVALGSIERDGSASIGHYRCL